LLSSRI